VGMEKYLEDIEVEVVRRGEVSEVRVQNVHHSVANGIRRAVIADLPSMAIEYVLIRENSSVLPDEMLSHRLGLVPVMADPSMFEYIDSQEEKRELDAVYNKINGSNALFMRLFAKNSSPEVVTVHSDEIQMVDKEGFEAEHPEQVFNGSMVRKGIPLVKLAPGQVLEIKMIAIKGRGREHAKWSHTSLCTYKFSSDVQIPKNSFTSEEYARLRKYFRGEGIRFEGGRVEIDPDQVVVNQDLFSSEFRERILFRKRENSFFFRVETLGEDGVTFLCDGVRELIGRTEALAKAIPTLSPEK
jgi:DNA-directed RNA polymerases I and III subunit RPAC1